jgi:nicotinate-nucleotide pyrophosphorylase (carboxylating)
VPEISFESALEQLITLALAEDLGDRGDVTSQVTISADQVGSARMLVKSAGVIAGTAAVDAVFARVDPRVAITWHVLDGARVEPNTVIADVRGAVRSLLTGERTALNFIQRMSGIATLTAQFVAAIDGTQAKILDTRKTLPGWRMLEKYAVRAGGGCNHRIGLFDMVLIKDNHVDAAGGITQAVRAARSSPDAAGLEIEVEVRSFDELREALTLQVDRIMLDNMDEAQMREAVAITAGRVPLEASGNMALQRVRVVAHTGVDFISVGALTHSAPALDISMKIVSE